MGELEHKYEVDIKATEKKTKTSRECKKRAKRIRNDG